MMNVLKELENMIENTVGEEQKQWVEKYEKYLSVQVKIDVIRKSSEENSIYYSENGEIKYKNYSKEEREKVLMELEALKLEIEKILI
ncbi:TPA: hypothetical protein ACY4RA_003033 [Clostridium perfringens]|jgi:hypothetical protein|nr:hypothetical protein [Clostridium perfringens]MDM0701897.1 hypothetical protein [Clostridium perfringens]MDM0781309.1 hypothetical protein [Clostridium perfringens]MDU3334866.1 hypothetical protein [Clostridium perfringens]MDU4052558.1 hypothetical protein [Clostridium perfringens]